MTASQIEVRLIRVRGTVQGVGFRPTVFLLAQKLGIKGEILNDAEGVLIKSYAEPALQEQFISAIRDNCPPLGKIDSIESSALETLSGLSDDLPASFSIVESKAGKARTSMSPDARTCESCLADTLSPFNRRYRYPFTNCTHCGPRLSIIKKIPYDRPNTSMACFVQCRDCLSEYEDPSDRRFHAQPNACHACGPRASLARMDGHAFSLDALTQLDDVDGAAVLILKGEIISVKGIGGFHIACDATNDDTVNRLRQRKGRYAKPFALMAKDLDTIKRYCLVSPQEEELLSSPAAPIVLLQALEGGKLSPAVAPGQNALGFMLPYTPLHHLLLRRIKEPIVLTSANLTDEPQCIDLEAGHEKLSSLVDYVLDHNREIVNRIDDSVVRVVLDRPRLLRRARGYAPAPLSLPPGFGEGEVLAMGGELKNTFCLLKDGKAILSQHMGDLEDAATFADYKKNLALYENLFQSNPLVIAIDKHPEYLSNKFGRELAETRALPLFPVQHHHAHVAACLLENQRGLNEPPVLGVVLDGLGYGENNELWGGEFLLADYRGFERLGTFKPVALLGGSKAMREPWRNTFAHLMAEMGWPRYLLDNEELELTDFLKRQKVDTLLGMLASGTNSPKASSAGRLFDAVAAACGICRESASYEGQAAIEFEALASTKELELEDEELVYPFGIPVLKGSALPYVEPIAMWQAVLGDLSMDTPASVISARFHKGLAKVIAAMVRKLSMKDDQRVFDTVALSGGVFQNSLLLRLVVKRLEPDFKVLSHSLVPANDGGIALGQAAIAAANSSTWSK